MAIDEEKRPFLVVIQEWMLAQDISLEWAWTIDYTFKINQFKCPLLEINRTVYQIAQAYIHTQRHMKDVWSEMVSSTLCLALYCSFTTWFMQTIWNNSSSTTNQLCRLITTLFLLVIHFYDYEQSKAPPSILPLCE